MAVLISIPLLNRYVYPFLQRRKIPFGPVRRVVMGFALASASMTWAACLQHAVYATSPCRANATTCQEGTGVSPLSAWLVLPTPIALGISESIAVVSAMELGYMMAPPSLRSMVNAFFLFMQAASAALVLLFVPIMQDPYLVWPFAITAAMLHVAGFLVWRSYRHLDKEAGS